MSNVSFYEYHDYMVKIMQKEEAKLVAAEKANAAENDHPKPQMKKRASFFSRIFGGSDDKKEENTTQKPGNIKQAPSGFLDLSSGGLGNTTSPKSSPRVGTMKKGQSLNDVNRGGRLGKN